MSAAEHKIACYSTRTARKHLKYLCDKILQKESLQQLELFAEQAHTETLILVIRQRNKKPLEEFLLASIQRTHNPSLTWEMANLLLLLAGDAPILSAVSVRYHPYLLQICTAVRNGKQVKQQLQNMKNYGIDLSNVLALSIQHEFSEQCVNFYKYLVDEVKNLHSKERKDPIPSIIPGTYNPQSGAAYYFTPHGNQICRQPQYTIEQSSKNYDNDPTVDEPCCKKFPGVSYGWYSYIFLWYCPIHGHCYGFHIIACGGEGRKDPFSSLYNICLLMFSMILLVNIMNTA